EDLSSLLINDNEKQRFFRLVAFSGHGKYPGYPKDIDSKSTSKIAGLPSSDFQEVLAALKDKNMAFMFLSSCYSGGTNLVDIHLSDYTIPCPIYVDSSFDMTTVVVDTPYVTEILDKVRQMIFPVRSSGSPFETSPRQLAKSSRDKLSLVEKDTESAVK